MTVAILILGAFDSSITWQEFPQKWTGKYAKYNMIPCNSFIVTNVSYYNYFVELLHFSLRFRLGPDRSNSHYVDVYSLPIPFIFQNLYHSDNYHHTHICMLIIDQMFTLEQQSPFLLYDGDIVKQLAAIMIFV